MGIQTTVELSKREALYRIELLLDSKKNRIIQDDNPVNIAAIIEDLYPDIEYKNGTCLLNRWLSEEEFNCLKNNLDKLSDKILEVLLEDLNEDDFENYSIVPD